VFVCGCGCLGVWCMFVWGVYMVCVFGVLCGVCVCV